MGQAQSTAMQGIAFDYFSMLIGQKRAERLVRRSGLASGSSPMPAVLDLPTFWRLCAENIQSLDDESHGIAPEPVARGSLSVLFTSAKEGDTLGEAVERFTEAARLIRKECHFILGKSRGALHLSIRPLDSGDLRAEIYVECFAVVAHCAFRWMTGRRLDPLRLRGAARLRAMGDTILSSLHVPVVRRGTGVTISYGVEDVAAPILALKYKAWGDPEFESFLHLLSEHDEAVAAAEKVRPAVLDLIRSGLRTQSAVSAALKWSPATLRRRLAAEGTSYRELLGEIRHNELQNMLASDISLSDAAEKLGLSDDRSLRRLCHASLGVSPRQYRQSLRGTPRKKPARRISKRSIAGPI